MVETADRNSSSARPPMFVERLTERIAGGELRFGFRSAESGDMQVSTSLHNRVVEIGITAEKPEAASALRAELPALESHLRDHALRLGEAQISTGTTLSGQSQMGEQRRHPQEWKANVLPVYRDEAVVENESVRLARTYGTGMRISLMA